MNDPSTSPHVVIVEDEEILQKFLVYHVEHAGYRATPTSSGTEMFRVIETEPVDLILLDLGLPDGDGLSWAQKIRERGEIPIVVLTGRKGDDDRIMALGLGADDYLTKPCDPRELLLRMRNILDFPGQEDAADFLRRQRPPVVFAGDYLTTGCVDGALRMADVDAT